MHHRFRLHVLSTAVFAALSFSLARADDAYIGDDQSWSDPTAWTNGAAPVSTDNVSITPVVPTSITNTLTLDVPATIASLTLGTAGVGTAVLNLSNHTLGAASVTIFSTGQITGGGVITASISSAGLITTTANTTLYTPATGSSTNSGTLSALTGGDLQLNSTPGQGEGPIFDNSAGIISAVGDPTAISPTAFVDIANLIISGGQITTNAGGQIRLNAFESIDNATLSGNFLLTGQAALSNCTISGNVTQQTHGLLLLGGNITNNANLTCPIYISSSTVLNGNGSISVSHGFTIDPNNSLTIGVNQTIHGSGELSLKGTFVNNGTILADTPYSGITIYPGPNLTINNFGTIAATNGGTFAIDSSASLTSTNGTLSATGSDPNNLPSEIVVANATITGGQLLTDAVGQLHLGNATLSDLTVSGNVFVKNTLTLSNVTFLQTVTIAVDGTATPILSGSIINNGTWDFPAASNLTTLSTQPVSLSGTGSLFFTGGNLNALDNATLIIPVTETISGYGGIAVASNAASITADVPSQGLGVGNSKAFFNSGTLSAINGGILYVSGTAITNNGTLSATGQSTPTVRSAIVLGQSGRTTSLSGGILTTDAVGRISLNFTTVSNAQLTGNFVSSLNSGILSNDTFTTSLKTTGTMSLAGNLTNNAAWTTAALNFINTVSITGNGTMLLTGAALNQANSANATVTLGPSLTLKGYGSINNHLTGTLSLSLINQGAITADPDPTGIGAATPVVLAISLPTPMTNTGTLSALPLGTLALASPANSSIANADGSILANGGVISASNLTISGGTLASSNGGQITLLNANTLSNILLSGNLTANGTLTLAGNVTSNATLISNSALALANASILASSGVIKVQSLSLPTSAAYNLSAGALIVTDPSALSALQAAMAQGSTSTYGLFTTAPNSALMLLNNAALATPFTTFGGVAVDNNSILIAPELLGDTDLSGTVDLNDLNTVLNNLGTTNPNWTAGNFDHAAIIDLNDLNDVLNNLGVSTLNNATVLAAEALVAANPTPEPASLATAGTLSALFLLRRKYRA